MGPADAATELCCLVALASLRLNQSDHAPTPLALPATCLGLGFAMPALRPDATARMVGGGACLCLGAGPGWTEGLLQLPLALVLLGFCLVLVRPATALSDQAARCALGVYLAHPLAIAVLLRTTSLPKGSRSLAGAACTDTGD